MAKLYFNYSTMNAGKSTVLLQADYNYRERGMRTLLLTARIDSRGGEGKIVSRIGISATAKMYGPDDDLFVVVAEAKGEAGAAEAEGADRVTGDLACVLVDEAQFLTPEQVWELARVADELAIPVMTYGLRVDFQGKPFPGSATLLAVADALREIRTICHCGSKATMVIRRDEEGRVVTDGAQVQIGGDETYVSLCRVHWREAFHGA